MAKLSILGVVSNIQILALIARSGKYVGVDDYGNKYYEAKPRKGSKQTRRWVKFKEKTDATNVPPMWHGWIHHQTDMLPTSDEAKEFQQDFIIDHQPNMTGTDKAYFPKGHVVKGSKRDSTMGDYEAWNPNS